MFYLGGELYRGRFLQRITYVKVFNGVVLRSFMWGYFADEEVKKRNIGKIDEVKGEGYILNLILYSFF